MLRATIVPERIFNLRVTTFAPNECRVWQDGTPLFRGVRQYTLTSRGDDATEVTMVETITGLMLPMIAGSLPDQGSSFERFLADLKAEAERDS